MGSRLNVILKRDGIITVSYSRIWANHFPIYLAFGPIAAWEGLSEHQHGTALFKSTWGESEWINNSFTSVTHMFDGGDEGSVLIDWDDKVLWYFTDFDFEKYGGNFWGSWFASWVDVFWPGWEALRPRTRSFRDISKKMGLKTELSYSEDWTQHPDFNREIFWTDENAKKGSSNSQKSYLAVVKARQLTFFRTRSYSDEDIIFVGPDLNFEKAAAHSFDFSEHVRALEKNSVICLVDYDKKQDFFAYGYRGEDANPFTAWPGWKAHADRQGLCSWLANTNVDWSMDTKVLETEIDTYFEKILKWCCEVGPTNEAISESLAGILSYPIQEQGLETNPFPRKADASGSITISGNEDNLDIDAWLKVSKSNQVKRGGNYRQFYEQMKSIYLSDSRLKKRLLTDRHHSHSNWEPDLEAYAVLNETNPNHTVQ